MFKEMIVKSYDVAVLVKVIFRLTIEGSDKDDAWEKVHEMSLTEMNDQARKIDSAEIEHVEVFDD